MANDSNTFPSVKQQAALVEAYQLKLRPITADDLEQLRQWRNQPEIRQHMVTQDEIGEDQQNNWFHSLPHKQHALYYSVEYRGTLIGYANITTTSGEKLGLKQQLETGLYLGHPKYCGTILAFHLGLALLDLCFVMLQASSVQARVRSGNQAAIRFNEKLGYQVLQQDEHWLHMQLKPENYEQAKQVLLRVVRT